MMVFRGHEEHSVLPMESAYAVELHGRQDGDCSTSENVPISQGEHNEETVLKK
jgi:hypothetical protein